MNISIKKESFNLWVAGCMALVFLCTVFSVTNAYAAMPRNEAIDIAYTAIEDSLGIEKDELVEYQEASDEGNGTWSFSFKLKEFPTTSDGLVVIKINFDQSIESLRGPSEVNLEDQLMKSFRRSQIHTIESLSLLQQEWQAHMQELQALCAQLKQKGKNSNWTVLYTNVLELARIPSDEAISRQEALNIAMESITSLPGWSKEALDMLVQTLEIFYVSPEVAKPVYQFTFSQMSAFSSEYIDRSYEYYKEKYLTPLYSYFGGTNESTPLFVSIRIDALSGELIEAPHVQYPASVENSLFDFQLIK